MRDRADCAEEREEAGFGYAEKRSIWMQRDGTLIDIKDMHDEHLNNARAMVERKITEAREAISKQEGIIHIAESVIKNRTRRLESLKNKKHMLFEETARREKIRKNDFISMKRYNTMAAMTTAHVYCTKMEPTIFRVHVRKGTGRVRVEIVEDKE